MDDKTIQWLKRLNDGFYRDNHASFSSTRAHAWDGWERVIGQGLPDHPSVLDCACGNMRFRVFLDERIGQSAFTYFGIDSCPELLPSQNKAWFQQVDIIDELMNSSLNENVKASPCDLTVCFGFMHHIPSFEIRASLLRALVDMTCDDGVIAVSFWQFAREESLHTKALETTALACKLHDISLDSGDYILGWQKKPGALRYCHSFEDDEIGLLIASCADGVKVVDRFLADGRSGKLNSYVVLRKRSGQEPV